MGKQSPVRVALDLETTGLHAEQDAILEVAAIKFRDEAILDTMETLIAPGRPIPFRVQRLTGITPQSILNAPAFESIAGQLQRFIGDYPIVGHSIPFDAAFLRRRGLMRTNPLIDTFELAAVLLPSLPGYALDQVARALGITVAPGRHRAMVDTDLAMKVFLALHRLLHTVDTPILKDLADLDAPHSWSLLDYLRHEWHERREEDGLRSGSLRGSLGDRMAAQLCMNPHILSFAVAQQPQITPSVKPLTLSLPNESSTSIEPRQSGNHAASRAIMQAFDRCTPLLLEVTVGGNDYTPALLPAMEWVSSQVEPAEGPCLVISVANAQNARRLYDATLPRLQASLKTELPTAFLAERDGYLCLHRWFSPVLRRTSGELSAEQARGIAKLSIWAQQTLTGERGELTLLPQEVTAWERISSGVEHIALADEQGATPYANCLYRKKGYCFSYRAEERVKKARIIVTTHAALLDDLTSSRSLLKQVGHYLVLDADLLEDECARWSSKEFHVSRLHELLYIIGAELPDGYYKGLLALAAPSLSEHGPGGLTPAPVVDKAALDARLLSWFQTLRLAHVAIDALFSALGQLLHEGTNGGGARDKNKLENAARGVGGRGGERTDQPLRLNAHMRNLASWMEVEHTWQQLAQRLKAVVTLVDEAQKLLSATKRSQHHSGQEGEEGELVAWELAALARRLLEQKKTAQCALEIGSETAPEGQDASPALVYWLRVSPPSAQSRPSEAAASPNQSAQNGESLPVLHAQIAQTASFIKRHLLLPGAGTVLAGVALSVDHDFSYYRGRYGLEPDTCPALSIATEFHEQTLLYLPDDVPEPNAPQYQRNLDEAIINLATMLDGQLVVLFTSYSALRSSYAAVKPLLETRNILTLGHGIDGSPRQLWQMFQQQERIVLLGTGSFWDGSEEVNRPPACILVSRLPMPVLNDPPVAAMAEHYSDQLHQVTVPMASLRVRRALNRLAWSGSGRNAVILFDRRVLSKEYGATILHTLPRCSQRQSAVSHMPEFVLDWLTTTGARD
jgi:DNA polymerase III epsilon subunit family exonuclease